MTDLDRPSDSCPIEGCEGFVDTHNEGSVETNLHTRPAKTLPEPTTVEWPMSIDLAISGATFPLWALNVDVDRGDEVTPTQAGHMAAELFLNAVYVAELNRAITESGR
ncbi:hypothetical protein [Salinibacterium sp.]|uniref:hypothetical protein n=1 Tax=Salinibacterium sp. TaxID=1915057 RepID=UPI00286C177F|nr:hypothetical protein [Salinibacterium sp.]